MVLILEYIYLNLILSALIGVLRPDKLGEKAMGQETKLLVHNGARQLKDQVYKPR